MPEIPLLLHQSAIFLTSMAAIYFGARIALALLGGI